MNMGLVGALGGLGSGVAGTAQMDLDEAKQARLEELRARNNRETNSLNNKERHDYSLQEMAAGHGYEMDRLGQEQDYSLAELAKRDEYERGQNQQRADLEAAAPTSDMKNMQFLRDEGGVSVADQYNDGKYQTNIRPPDKMVIAQYLSENGETQENINKFLSGNPTDDQLRDKLIQITTKSDVGSSPDEIIAKVDGLMKARQPEPGGAGGGADDGAIQKILSANPGKDEAWARRYLEHLRSQGKL